MALDLSSLEENPNLTSAATQPDSKPIRFKLSDIEPDPNQPRIEKKPEEIAEIGENIKARGIKQPISVKSHPEKSGKWIINDGELRYLGSQWAKVEDIPAIVDEDFDDFDQVNVNEKRFALRPMDLAKFIKRKLDEGVKKGEIARRLGKPADAITKLLALIDAPACVEAVYNSGRCTSPRALYELRALAEKFPEQVQEWADTAEDITRHTVAKLGDVLKSKKQPSQEKAGDDSSETDDTPQDSDTGEFSCDEVFDDDQSETDGEESEVESITNPGSDNDQRPVDISEGDDSQDDHTDYSSGKAAAETDAIKKPLLFVEYEGRMAAVLLNRRPSTSGLIHIRYEDGGGDDEVDAGRCKINLLTEG